MQYKLHIIAGLAAAIAVGLFVGEFWSVVVAFLLGFSLFYLLDKSANLYNAVSTFRNDVTITSDFEEIPTKAKAQKTKAKAKPATKAVESKRKSNLKKLAEKKAKK